MKANVGSVDRMFRLIGGIGVAVWGIVFESYWGLVGVALLATGVFSYCPLYPLFRIDTSKNDEQKETDQHQ